MLHLTVTLISINRAAQRTMGRWVGKSVLQPLSGEDYMRLMLQLHNLMVSIRIVVALPVSLGNIQRPTLSEL
jgi:hypothetical protein